MALNGENVILSAAKDLRGSPRPRGLAIRCQMLRKLSMTVLALR
jgi:hypothetical protein